MRAVVQRVSKASVAVGDEEVGRIGPGLLLLLGVSSNDGEEEARYIADKTLNLRIFPDSNGRFDRSALDIGAQVLVVSQFTLYGDTRRGRRPSFTGAAPPEQASSLVERTVALLAESGLRVETGRFQAHMAVSLVNDGPVTIMLDSDDRDRPRRG